MAQLQDHGGKNRLYVTSANALSKDKAVSRVIVEVDTSKWSSRKRNIITKSLKSGVAACGWELAELVRALAETVGSSVNTVSKWKNYIALEEVRPEKLEELLAYTAAWLRMTLSQEDRSQYRWQNYTEWSALESLDRGDVPVAIPLSNTMTYDEKREFIQQYLKASEDREAAALTKLIQRINEGATIQITYGE